MYVSLVEPQDMPQALQEVYSQASDGGRKFIGAVAHAPDHASRLFPYYNGIRYGTSLGPALCELLRMAIAQTTQCPICLAGRRADAFADGLTEDQLNGLRDPDSADLSPKQAAVVNFALKFGADHFAIGEADFRLLYEHFTEEEVIEIGMLCAQFLGFGRLVMVLGLENPVCAVPTTAAGRS